MCVVVSFINLSNKTESGLSYHFVLAFSFLQGNNEIVSKMF